MKCGVAKYSKELMRGNRPRNRSGRTYWIWPPCLHEGCRHSCLLALFQHVNSQSYAIFQATHHLVRISNLVLSNDSVQESAISGHKRTKDQESAVHSHCEIKLRLAVQLGGTTFYTSGVVKVAPHCACWNRNTFMAQMHIQRSIGLHKRWS